MKGYKHLTTEQKEQIPRVYQRTLHAGATAREVQATPAQVRYYLQAHGIPLSRSHGGACYRHADLVRELAADGVALAEIARRIGTTHQTVSKFLTQHHIPRTPFEQKGPNNPAWRGGRMVDKHGYILIHRPDHPQASIHGYVCEHRLVVEHMRGRPLLRTEVVHHIDGDRQNNDPRNLEVFQSNGQHLRATRRGIAPQISLQGKERIRESTHRLNTRRRAATHPAPAPDDPLS